MKTAQILSIAPLFLLLFIGCAERESAVLPGHEVHWHLASIFPFADWKEQEIRENGSVVYMESEPVVFPADFRRIGVYFDANGDPYVSVELYPEAAQRLAQLSEYHQNRSIVIVVNGVPELEYGISSQISRSMILDSFEDPDDAYEAVALMTGADPRVAAEVQN